MTERVHPLRFHLGQHIAGTFSDRVRFSAQLTEHINVVFSTSAHQFRLAGVDQAPLPDPEPNPAVLPDEFATDLYLFSNIEHPTRNGTLSIAGNGDARLFVPAQHIQIAGTPTFGLADYWQVVGTTCHEFEHNWRRGEGRATMNADAPAGIPMPRVNSWVFPNDFYWTEARRADLIDPFFLSSVYADHRFPGSTTLEWLLANVRVSPGTCALMNGRRGGATWSPLVGISTNVTTPIHVTVWAVPSNYRDPWDVTTEITNLLGGPTEFAWSERERGSPLAAVRVEHEGSSAVGYVSIFELEHHAALRGVGVLPMLFANFTTGLVALPPLNWPPPPPPRPPWEYDPRWRGAGWMLQMIIRFQWWMRNRPKPASETVADPERFAVKCDFCRGRLDN